MSKSVFFLTLLIIITSCSHTILRTGYQIDKSEYKQCNIIVKKFMHVSDSLKKIGEIRIGDSGFAIKCSEADAIIILKNEGCALNANIVDIVEETRPDVISSCYRCRAEFYTFKYPNINVQKDEVSNEENVNKRVSKDRSKNTVIGIMAISVGIIIGLLMVK